MKFKQYLNEVLQTWEKERIFSSKKNLLDNYLYVKMKSLNPERSYEDRDVYLEIVLKNDSDSEVKTSDVDNMITTWLTGEDAIKFGTELVEAGNDSLEKNRLQTYETLEILSALNGVHKGKFSRLIITKKGEGTPENYGSGYYYYDLLYVSNSDLESRLIKNVIIHWSPFEEEFEKQINTYSAGIIPVDKIDWSWEEIKEKFDRQMKQMEEDPNQKEEPVKG